VDQVQQHDCGDDDQVQRHDGGDVDGRADRRGGALLLWCSDGVGFVRWLIGRFNEQGNMKTLTI